MSNDRNKKKLTENQLDKRIILITGIVWVLLFALLIIKICSPGYSSPSDTLRDRAIIIMYAFSCTLGLWAIIFIIVFIIVDLCIIQPKTFKEEMSDITKNLSKDSFTEIYYKLQNSNDDIIVDIVKKGQYKFYAKLDEDQDNNIIIIAKIEVKKKFTEL